MTPKELNFYEFAGIVVPGSITAIGLAHALPLPPLFVPTTAGELGGHVILAYGIGHLVQAIGNFMEVPYWACWGGMPTDWPRLKARQANWPGAEDSVMRASQSLSAGTDAHSWKARVRMVRSRIYATGKAERLETFNANYGMFRGLAASGLVLIACDLAMGAHGWTYRSVLAGLVVVSWVRMHRYGVHYAEEFFGQAGGLHASVEAR